MNADREIFISYKREDKLLVASLVNDIRERVGVDPWIDMDGIKTGAQFEDEIMRAIEKCKVLVFAISESALQSDYTRSEVEYARSQQKKICPVLINGPVARRGWFWFKFSGIDCIDYTVPDQREKLFRDLREWACGNEQVSDRPVSPSTCETQPTDEVVAIQKELDGLSKEERELSAKREELGQQWTSFLRKSELAWQQVDMLQSKMKQAESEARRLDSKCNDVSEEMGDLGDRLRKLNEHRISLEKMLASARELADSRDVFICYSHKEGDYARAVELFLDRCGFSWWPYVKVKSLGYKEGVLHNISHSRCCVCIVTAKSLVSDHVREELAMAKKLRKPVVALCVDSAGGMDYSPLGLAVSGEAHVAAGIAADPSSLMGTLKCLAAALGKRLDACGTKGLHLRSENFWRKTCDEIILMMDQSFRRRMT